MVRNTMFSGIGRIVFRYPYNRILWETREHDDFFEHLHEFVLGRGLPSSEKLAEPRQSP